MNDIPGICCCCEKVVSKDFYWCETCVIDWIYGIIELDKARELMEQLND